MRELAKGHTTTKAKRAVMGARVFLCRASIFTHFVPSFSLLCPSHKLLEQKGDGRTGRHNILNQGFLLGCHRLLHWGLHSPTHISFRMRFFPPHNPRRLICSLCKWIHSGAAPLPEIVCIPGWTLRLSNCILHRPLPFLPMQTHLLL